MNKCAAMACIPSFGILTDFKERKIGIFCQLLLIKFVQRCIKKKLCVFHHLETIDEGRRRLFMLQQARGNANNGITQYHSDSRKKRNQRFHLKPPPTACNCKHFKREKRSSFLPTHWTTLIFILFFLRIANRK